MFARTFESTIQSFAPVTRADILQVQPKRIDIVTLSEPMTLKQFAERYRSAAPAAELAILNHLPDDDARLQAGMLVKRVVE